MQALREISAGTHIDGRRNRSRMGGYTPAVPEGMFGFGDYMFKEAESDGKFTKCDKRDIDRTIASIKKAHDECETVIVVFHSHEIKRDTDDEPDDFIVEFAHACIDAGANAVIGTGTHQLKAVEMYKGYPIFYSIGNFIFQTGKFATKLPADFNERYHMPYGISSKEKIARRSKGGTIGLNSDVNNYRSLMPFLTFEDGKLIDMKLYPLRLDMDTSLPALADEAEAEIIGKYLEERNEPFGTELVFEDGAFVLKK